MPQPMTMNGAKAPAAASPGSGTGNIPFAPGIMSGNLGQQHTSAPRAGEVAGSGMTLNINQPPAAKPPVPAPAPQPQAPAIDPAMMMQVYDQYFRALMESVENNQMLVDGIY